MAVQKKRKSTRLKKNNYSSFLSISKKYIYLKKNSFLMNNYFFKYNIFYYNIKNINYKYFWFI